MANLVAIIRDCSTGLILILGGIVALIAPLDLFRGYDDIKDNEKHITALKFNKKFIGTILLLGGTLYTIVSISNNLLG